MKHVIFTILLCLAAITVNAQQKDDKNFAKRLYEARLAEMCLRLNITDEQKGKFAAIYEQYCNEMSSLRDKPHKGKRPMGPGMRPGAHKKNGKPGMRRGMRPGMRKDEQGKQKDDNKDANQANADKQKKDGKQQLSDAEKVKMMKEKMEKQKKAQEIRLAYTEKFATVLTDKQLLKLFEVENSIQQKMHNRAFKARPKKR